MVLFYSLLLSSFLISCSSPCVVPQCKCNAELKLIDCSQQGLLEVPTDSLQILLGQSTYTKLNLSWNGISELKEGAFVPVPFNVIDLSNNYFRNGAINQRAFKGLENLLQELHLGSRVNDNAPKEDSLGFLLRLQAIKRLSLRGFDLGDVSGTYWQHLPQLEELNLHESRITNLRQGAFSDLHDTIQTLRIQSNPNLIQIGPGVISNLTRLYNLDLTDNQIIKFPANVLANSPVQQVSLENNRLESMPFGGDESALLLTSLRYLNLRNNSADSLTAGYFARFHSLEFVSLNENSALTRLRPGDLNLNNKNGNKLQIQLRDCQIRDEIDQSLSQNWDQLSQIDLSGNPIWCSCSTIALVQRNEFARMALKGECQMPNDLRGRQIATLTANENCPNEDHNHANIDVIIIVVSVFAAVVLALVVFGVVHLWRRRKARLAAAEPTPTSSTQRLKRRITPQEPETVVNITASQETVTINVPSQTEEPYYAAIPEETIEVSSPHPSLTDSGFVITTLPPPMQPPPLPPRCETDSTTKKQTRETSL